MKIYQGKEYVECVFNNDLIPFIKCQNNCSGIVKGEIYSLQSPSFDGIEMEKKVYKVLGIVFKYHGVDINSVIVKQISGTESTVFEINRLIAKELGVQYEPKIFLLPLNLNWQHEECPLDMNNFNVNDLSTYPSQNGYINYIILKLKGFSAYRNTHIITPNGKLMDKLQFISNLKCHYIFDVDEEGPIQIGDTAKFEIITEEIYDLLGHKEDNKPTYSSRQGYLCDPNGDIWIRIDLVGKGVKTSTLQNKNINDLFRFSWIEEDRFRNTQNIPLPNFSNIMENAMKGLASTAIKGLVRELNGRYEEFNGNRWVRINENNFRGRNYQRVDIDDLHKLF